MLSRVWLGKAGAMHGIAQDATPFRFNEQDTRRHTLENSFEQRAITITVTSRCIAVSLGRSSRRTSISVGLLPTTRHMVGDKWQVRTTGKVDKLTRQPVKGRRDPIWGDGRDALLAHGTSFLLQDRLMNCSDYSTAWICKRCGLLSSLGYDTSDDLGLGPTSQTSSSPPGRTEFSSSVKMRGPRGGILSTVFRYLVAELMAMGIKIALQAE
ncbi:hypothetical protein PGTUg99_002445 [Puccinia graminis f. sp. tritici]|uniref:DNA-directed RNA polymerase n=1 Tax=Puccinia graminis f. sp. tritici TaxID=56615 RepID=A0A5B0MJZ3_PUCGR|nr:hypothetical protein PGTUg99_002445 [Puccinia graminis f. sp. tritici]